MHGLGLTIAAAQPMCRAYDVARNAVSHAEVTHAAAARVVVFLELSLTGYVLDAPPSIRTMIAFGPSSTRAQGWEA